MRNKFDSPLNGGWDCIPTQKLPAPEGERIAEVVPLEWPSGTVYVLRSRCVGLKTQPPAVPGHKLGPGRCAWCGTVLWERVVGT